MAVDTKPFAPLVSAATLTGQMTLQPSTTVTASTTAAASAQFAGNNDNNGYCQIQIANKTSAWAHVNFGDLTVAAVTAATVAAGYPVAPGGVVIVTLPPSMNAASVILDAAPSGSAAVVFTRGIGS